MRPTAILQAELLYAASIAMMVAVAAMTWTDTAAMVGAAMTIGLNAFVVGLSTLLLVLTTRMRNRVALWLLVALTVVGLAGYLWQVASGVLSVGLLGVLTTLQTGAAVVAIVLLFRSTSRHWLAATIDIDEEDA